MEQNNNTLKIGTLLQGSSYQYRIEKVLGQGSFGITYLASVKMTGALGTIDANVKVAIKEFFMGDINGRQGSSVEGLTEGSLPYKYKQRFKKEAENIAKFDHPNIVKVLDFIEANNTFYYVMEYIDGEDVLHYMNNNPLPEAEAVSIIKEVGRALSYMHEEKNMLHLDLKPGNIMRRRSDGHIFLIDFGLTKIYADDGKPETSTTIGQGTQGYAPLEQTNPSSKKNSFGPTIDVYALGATLLKLLTAESIPPASDVLNGDDLLEDIMAKHQVSEHLQSAIMHAMEPKPKKRTSSVRQFINDIKISKTENNQDEDATVYDDGRVKDVEVQSFVAVSDSKEDDSRLNESEEKYQEDEYDKSSVGYLHGITKVKGLNGKSGDINQKDEKVFFQSKKEQEEKDNLVNKEKKFLGYFSLLTIIVISIIVYNEFVNKEEIETKQAKVSIQWTSLCPDNKHPHFVDLCLPSGTKWACCNIGASKPEEFGDLFAWGETSTKSEYERNNYIYYRSNDDRFVDIGDNIQGTFRDAATEIWGQSWGIPTSEQYSELLKYCKCEWVVTDRDKEKGMKFIASNGNMIYFPASAFHGTIGRYWASNKESSEYAYYLLVKAEEVNCQKWMTKSEGLNVRPIYRENKEKKSSQEPTNISQICPDEKHPHEIDLGLPSGTKWACCNVGSDNPIERGKEYAWGETKSKSEYTWKNYQHCNGTHNTCRKLGNIASTQYDVAYKQWGHKWKIPTVAECRELNKYCKSKWLVVKGKTRGVLLEGLNHNKIFFPEDISRWNKEPLELSFIWSSQCVDKFPQLIGSDSVATCMVLGKETTLLFVNQSRFSGLKIRPVSK